MDNAKENVFAMRDSLSSPKKDEAKNLFPTHRLDVTTSGVVIVAKTSNAAKIFSKILRDGHVEKRYLVLTKKPPTLGVMLHEYEPSERMVGEGARMVKMKSMGMDLLKDDLNVYLKNKMKIPSNVAMLRQRKANLLSSMEKNFTSQPWNYHRSNAPDSSAVFKRKFGFG